MDEHLDWYGGETATFGDRLAAAREAAGLGQAELARRLGIRTATLRDWEDDLGEPRANRLQMVAGLLGVSLVWLLTGEGEGVPPPSEDPPPAGRADLRAALTEVRALRSDLDAASGRMARLEQRLRAAVAAGEQPR